MSQAAGTRHLGPREVEEITHVWIPVSDGARLAARIWLPTDAEDDPVPAVLEYIPYRKNDATAKRDEFRQPQLASYGYAAVRVDMRGSGDSDGLMLDEYLPQELDDAVEVIAWLAKQPWCTGEVGMTGISWGGFNALQVAALRPPELKAIVSVCSTDDRYADDIHYHGGCVVGSDMLSWASTMLVAGARPPDPSFVGEGWREAWLERLEVTPFVETWLAHQRRDDYWKHGSVAEDLSAMDCAVYMVGGWDDAYRDAILRVLEGYPGPRKGLIGPWGHIYPDLGHPGAPIDFVGECVRFWDHWLKGVENGIMDEPMLRVFLRETAEDPPSSAERVGRWASEPTWPSPTVERRRVELRANERLADIAGEAPELPPLEPAEHDIVGSQSAGLEAGAYMGSGIVEDLPGDQRREDGLALTYTSWPLAAPLTVLGQPVLQLDLAVDQPAALVSVRLCEVTPSGYSRLVARGLLNLTHREGHEHPVPMVPGERTQVVVELNATGHTFSEGSQVRVAISPTYWPWAWPSPEPVTLSVIAGPGSVLDLPIRSPRDDNGELPPFVLADREGPEHPTRGGHRHVTHDWITGRSELECWADKAVTRLPGGLELIEETIDRFTIIEGEPLSAEVVCERSSEISRGDWHVRVETYSTMTSDAERFLVTNALDAYERGIRVAAKRWVKEIPRDHV
jgi:uncharacterized protein